MNIEYLRLACGFRGIFFTIQFIMLSRRDVSEKCFSNNTFASSETNGWSVGSKNLSSLTF